MVAVLCIHGVGTALGLREGGTGRGRAAQRARGGDGRLCTLGARRKDKHRARLRWWRRRVRGVMGKLGKRPVRGMRAGRLRWRRSPPMATLGHGRASRSGSIALHGGRTFPGAPPLIEERGEAEGMDGVVESQLGVHFRPLHSSAHGCAQELGQLQWLRSKTANSHVFFALCRVREMREVRGSERGEWFAPFCSNSS